MGYYISCSFFQKENYRVESRNPTTFLCRSTTLLAVLNVTFAITTTHHIQIPWQKSHIPRRYCEKIQSRLVVSEHNRFQESLCIHLQEHILACSLEHNIHDDTCTSYPNIRGNGSGTGKTFLSGDIGVRKMTPTSTSIMDRTPLDHASSIVKFQEEGRGQGSVWIGPQDGTLTLKESTLALRLTQCSVRNSNSRIWHHFSSRSTFP